MSRKYFVLICCIALSLEACASAPKPAECKGEFKPVNQLEQKGMKLPIPEKVVSCIKGDLHG